MTIRFNTYDYDALFGAFTTFFIIMAGFAILVWTIFYFIKKSDKNKPVFATRAKILEKNHRYSLRWMVSCRIRKRRTFKTQNFRTT